MQSTLLDIIGVGKEVKKTRALKELTQSDGRHLNFPN